LEKARVKILKSCQEKSRVYTIKADYTDLSQVKSMCREIGTIVEDYPSMDVLINNAGIYTDTYHVTMDGYEQTYQTNVLASHIITSMLWNRVSERIINVASISSCSSSLSTAADVSSRYTDLGGTTSQYSGHRAYSDSKLLNIIQTILQDAARPSAAPTINCLDPGTVNTKMLYAGWGPIGIDISKANDQTYLATSMDDVVLQSSGKYFVGGRVSRPPPASLDPEIQHHVLDMLQTHTSLPLFHH
jgi:NAD(P)-dependent dehydrogenase (short-subunit alcohol dehydrogenase family)